MSDVLAEAEKAIPAEIRMISGCKDSQTSADVSNVASFKLPDPAGRAGGALTSCLLNVLYSDKTAPNADLSFQDVLLQVRDILATEGYSQIPQLSSSRPLDVKQQFEIVPDGCTGERRALLIGINYVGQQGELSGCHNDVLNMKEYIMDVHGFKEENITVLLDDGSHTNPTMENILKAYGQLVSQSQSGDCCYCHYSGHGGKLADDSGDEADGYDETLVPLDYESAGQIRDDTLYKNLVGAFKQGVICTAVMDCCHSGSVLDLPFVFYADGESEEMVAQEGFDFGKFNAFAAALAGGASLEEAAVDAAVDACCNIL